MPARFHAVSPQGGGRRAQAPVFTPAAGTYSAAQSVVITDAEQGAVIYYTLDGSQPNSSSAVYSAPIAVAASETINAIAIAPNLVQSPMASALYTLQAAAPTFSPGGGTYPSTQSVTISDATPGSTIYYTTNGTTPTTGSAVYSGPVNVAAIETLKAIATAAGFTQSGVGSAAYVISAAPVVQSSGVNWQPGHGYLTAGAGTNQEFAQAIASPTVTYVQNFFEWKALEPTQGSYSTWSTTANQCPMAATLVSLNTTFGATRPIYFMSSIKTIRNIGAAGVTSAQAPSYDGTQSTACPNYLINNTGRLTGSGGSGLQYLRSTDGKFYTNALPLSPNASQTGWWLFQWNGTAYTYELGPNWYSPVAAQCLANCEQACTGALVGAFTDGAGNHYAAQPLGTHPLFLGIESFDEEGGPGLGGGGGSAFLGTPASDATVMMNATNGGGGVPYVNPVNGGSVASNSPPEVFKYRLQTFSLAKQSAPSTYISCCFSFLWNSGNTSATTAQLRTHINDMYLAGVGMNSQDVYGGEFGIPYPAGAPAWANYASQGIHTRAHEILVGCHFANETVEPPGAITFPTGLGQPAPGGFDYRGKMDIRLFVGFQDYEQGFANNSLSQDTTNMVDAIWNTAQFFSSPNVAWGRCGSTFSFNDWLNWIYQSDGKSVAGSTPVGVSGLNFSTQSQQIPTSLMYGPTITSINIGGTQATISWAALPLTGPGGVGPNMTVQVYANGVARGAPQSGTSFTDTSYVPGTIYTLGMVNGYGAGPKGAPLIGITGQWWASNSVWNTPIPPNGFSGALGNSALVMSTYASAGGNLVSAFRPQTNTFTTGFVTAPPGQSTIRWSFTYGASGTWSFPHIAASGAVGTQLLNNYNEMVAAGDTDRHQALFDTDQQVFYSIYSGANQGAGGTGPIPVVTAAPFPLTGGGWWINYPFNQTESAGPAAGAANSGGVIRPDEWTAGKINHALAVVWPAILSGDNPSSPPPFFGNRCIYPALTGDNANSGNQYLPEGARLQLDPSLTDTQLQALGVTSAMLPVCHALQKYGGYNIDIAGPFPTQIKFESNLGGANQYPGTADLPLALMSHLAWIPGPYLTGVVIGTGGVCTYAYNYSSADGQVHVGDYLTVIGTNTGSGSLSGFTPNWPNSTVYKVSAATASSFTLILLNGTAIASTAGTPVGLIFTTSASLEYVATAEALGLVVSGP